MWKERGEITGALRHVRGGASVEEPITGGLGLLERDVVQCGEQLRVRLGRRTGDMGLRSRGRRARAKDVGRGRRSVQRRCEWPSLHHTRPWVQCGPEAWWRRRGGCGSLFLLLLGGEGARRTSAGGGCRCAAGAVAVAPCDGGAPGVVLATKAAAD